MLTFSNKHSLFVKNVWEQCSFKNSTFLRVADANNTSFIFFCKENDAFSRNNLHA